MFKNVEKVVTILIGLRTLKKYDLVADILEAKHFIIRYFAGKCT